VTPAEEIAAVFAGVLIGWLTEAEMAEVRRRNATPESAGNACASHDYCDANMAMDPAFTLVTHHPAGAFQWIDNRLWSEAWGIAKRKYLTAPVAEYSSVK
jgi:hypothetical protein